MTERTEIQKDVIIRQLKFLGMEKDRAKIIRIVTNGSTPTSSIDALWDYEAKIIIESLGFLIMNPNRKKDLINLITVIAPVISSHFNYTSGDPIKNCLKIIGMRVKALDDAHYVKIDKISNLLWQIYEQIEEMAGTEVTELLKELNIQTEH